MNGEWSIRFACHFCEDLIDVYVSTLLISFHQHIHLHQKTAKNILTLIPLQKLKEWRKFKEFLTGWSVKGEFCFAGKGSIFIVHLLLENAMAQKVLKMSCIENSIGFYLC